MAFGLRNQAVKAERAPGEKEKIIWTGKDPEISNTYSEIFWLSFQRDPSQKTCRCSLNTINALNLLHQTDLPEITKSTIS